MILQFPNLLPIASTPVGQETDMIALSIMTEAYLQDTLKTIQSQFGTIGGFIHTHPLPQVATSGDDFFPATEMELLQSIYSIAKHLKPSLNNGYFVAVTQVDGQLATSGEQAYSVVGSGLSGFVKALQREWMNTHCRFLDLNPQLPLNKAAEIVLEEIADPDIGLVEVGRSQKQRLTLGLEQTKAIFDPQEKPNQESVFLVSGGGRGITADCILELAQAYQCKFILLGRTPLSTSEPEWASGCIDRQELQQKLIKDSTQKGQNLTPVVVNNILHSLSSQREIRHTLEKIKQLGGEAIYLCVDLTQKAELQEKLNAIVKDFGDIKGIIHGAGNLADKRLEKKTLADWHQVFDAKIVGLRNLLSVIELAQLKYLILFSSVASYFGNAGQTDYALANEILNKFAYACQSLYPQLRVTSINWGPWEKGMMNPLLQKYYQEQGIDLIPAAVGTRFFREELGIAKPDVAQQIVISGSLSIPTSYTSKQQQEDSYERDLKEANNPFLSDHKIGDDAVLPMTCAINWMVKNCEDRLPNYKVRVIKDFQVLKGIRLAQSSELHCVSHLNPLDLENDCLGYSLQINSLSQDKPYELPHYQGTLFLSNQWETLPFYTNLDLESNLEKQVEDLYGIQGCLFHGKTFQGVRQVLQINEQKITSLCNLASIDFNQQGQFAVNSFNPYLADVQLHNVLIWTYHYLKQGCLPTGVEKIEQFYPLNFEQDFYVSTRIITRNKIKIVVDIFAHDRQGKILMKWSRVSYTVMNKLSTLFWGKEV